MITFLLFTFFLSVFPADFKAEATTFTVTKTFTCMEYDGYIYADTITYSSYDKVWSAQQGTTNWGSQVMYVGQAYDGSNYHIYRGFLYFSTSAIPDGATILSANLTLYMKLAPSAPAFDLTVQNGQPTYPHMPMQSGDYYYMYYTGDGGKISTTGISSSEYNVYNITLNSNGLQWINKEGVTKLCLRSNRDINKDAPSGNEYITIYTYEKGSGYAPKLTVKYSYEGYKYVFYGPYNEENGLRASAINITVYPAYGSPFNFTLDGSYTLELEYKPLMFKWKLNFNYSRTYQPIYSYEEIYIFIPESPYFYYNVEIIDFVGLHNTYIECQTYANGTILTVERKKLSTGKGSLCLTEFKRYSYNLIADEGIFSLGTVETPQRPIWEPAKITFIITPAMLEAEPTNFQGISLTAKRVNETCIQISYIDNRSRTQSISVTIYSTGKFNGLTEEYSQTYTSQQIAIFWKDALPDKDYIVEIQVEHADYGTLTWKIPCNSPNPPGRQIIDWNTIFGWIADWPITPSNFVSAIIVFAVIVLGGFKDSAFALLLGAITAGVLIMLGWLGMSWAILSVIVSLIIAYAIVKGRRTWIER